MAEGHAVVRQKHRILPLVGQPLRDVRMPKRWGDRPRGLVGEHLTGIETHGKHLLLHLSTGEWLHTHGGPYGSWQVGPAPLDYRKDERHIRLRLLTEDHEAVFYHGPTVELLTPEERAAHPKLNALGPDVMADAFDRAEAARRIRACGATPVGSAVQDQRAVAGVGNIFASEGLFLAGIDPERPAEAVTAEELEKFWDAVIPLMWAGTTRYGRTRTTPPELQERGEYRWVYQRKGKPCHVCGAPVELVRLAPFDRAAYRCPQDQR